MDKEQNVNVINFENKKLITFKKSRHIRKNNVRTQGCANLPISQSRESTENVSSCKVWCKHIT